MACSATLTVDATQALANLLCAGEGLQLRLPCHSDGDHTEHWTRLAPYPGFNAQVIRWRDES